MGFICVGEFLCFFFFSSRRRHTRFSRDWSSDVCSSDLPGFPARSFVSTNESKPNGGQWHLTPDGQWLWKGDTSSDELVGHYFGYAIYFDLVADEAEKAQIRAVEIGRASCRERV